MAEFLRLLNIAARADGRSSSPQRERGLVLTATLMTPVSEDPRAPTGVILTWHELPKLTRMKVRMLCVGREVQFDCGKVAVKARPREKGQVEFGGCGIESVHGLIQLEIETNFEVNIKADAHEYLREEGTTVARFPLAKARVPPGQERANVPAQDRDLLFRGVVFML